MVRACFVGGARYSEPLDPTSASKFRALARIADLTVVGFASDRRVRSFTQHARFVLLPDLPWAPLRHAMMLAATPAVALWAAVARGAEVLVAQSPYEGAAAAVAKILARAIGRRVALVVESHGDFEEGPFLQRRVRMRGVAAAAMRMLARFAFSQADALRAVSSSTQAQVEHWAPGRPVERFAAWTDLDLFLRAGDARPHRAVPTILFAGVLVEAKGVHHLIDALAHLPTARLVVAGAAKDEAYARGLRDRAARLGLDGRIDWLGPLPQGDLAMRMAAADVLVLPSLSEALGRVVFEAMACGTPVVASRVGGIPDLVRDGENGFLVPPGDATALAARVAWLLDHHAEARAMGERGRAFAREFFSEEAYVAGYARLFASALGGRR